MFAFHCTLGLVRVFVVLREYFARRTWLVAGFVSILLVAMAGCQPADPTADAGSEAKKVAVFRGGEITESEVQEQVTLLAQQSGMGEVKPDSPQYDTMVQQALPQIVALEVSRAYAEEQNITVSDQDVNQEIETIKEQVASQAPADVSRDEAFKQALEQNNLTEDQLRDDIRQNLPLQKVQEKITGDAQPSDQDVRDYYEQNKEAEFSNAPQRCARHILFNNDQEQKAEEVKTQLQEGEEFGPLAEEFSQDPQSAAKGGDLGCLEQDMTVPNFNDALFNAEQGEIVGPIETEFGFHLIEVTDIQDASVTPFSEAEDGIRQQLASQQESEKFQQWIEGQIEDRNVKYLNGYEPPQSPPSQPASAQPGSSTPQPSGE